MLSDTTVSILETALIAALDAGNYISSRFETELVVHTKTSLADVATDVDETCERKIRETILSAFPSHSILGEEAVSPGRDAAIQATEQLLMEPSLWIVDPLDGTTNFVSGIPLSVVSIAYAKRGIVETGIVYDPYREELFYAIRGQGAYRADKAACESWLQSRKDGLFGVPIRVGHTTEMRRVVMATGLPMRHKDRAKMMERATQLILSIKSLRTLGAAALHLAYVAAGRIDLFWEFELNAWDIAAGVLLVEEAGGYVSEMNGDAYSIQTRDIVSASSKRLCDETRGQLLECDSNRSAFHGR